ncbi:hypothetical protein [Streptomyces phaeochromogenes]
MRTIRTRLRFGVPGLPDDPTTGQVDARVELAELLQPTGVAREWGLAPDAPEALATHREAFAWVVGALRAQLGS